MSNSKLWEPKLEIEMSPVIMGWLKSKRYRVYGEVPDKKGIIDHVGKRGNVIIAVEMKLTGNFQLLFQGFKNTWYCNKSYIVFPFSGKYIVPRSPDLAKWKYICLELGVGILRYSNKPSNMNTNYVHEIKGKDGIVTKIYISEWLKPKYNRNPKYSLIIKNNLTENRLDKIGGIRYN